MNLVSLKHLSGRAFNITIGQHQLTSDAAPDEGGHDAGPGSIELFAASMGACMGAYIATYCQTANLPHEGMEIDIVCDLLTEPKRIGGITIDITMPEGFPQNRRKAVERAAQSCSVHNTLHNPPEISIEVVD